MKAQNAQKTHADATKGSTPIKLLANATDLIGLLAHEGPLSPADIADRMDLPRSSVYRLIEGLNVVDLTEALPDARVRLGARWLRLADAARDGMTEWSAAPAVLQELAERTSQTAYLSVLRNGEAMCVDWRQGRGIDVLALKPGRSLPLYAGAAGRVMLAYGVDAEAFLTGAPFRALTPNTLVTAEALRQDVARTREQGFVHSSDDVTPGIGAIGVAVTNGSGSLLAAVSLGGIAEEVTARRDELVRTLRAFAGEIIAPRDIRT